MWLTPTKPSRTFGYQVERRSTRPFGEDEFPFIGLGRSLRFNRAILDELLMGQTSGSPRS